MVDVYVGIGSNVDPKPNLLRAVGDLERHFGALRSSEVFRSAAYGFSGDDFLNMVVAFSADADPGAVDGVLSQIEYDRGRIERRERFASRTLDLDLLLYGALVDPRVRVPREDVLRFPFVLAPLAGLAPDLRHPVTGTTMTAAWARMARAGCGRLERLGPLAELR